MTSLLVDPADCALMGDLTVPGDKSIGHRALLFSLLARGRMRIRGLGDGADNGRSAKAITQLGAKVTRDGAHVVVDGPGLRTLVAPTGGIDCGNSGTTIRLLCGMVAGAPFATTLHGDESLSQRPMRRVIEPLTQMGAVLRGEARGKDVVPPLIVGPATGPLRAIDYALPVASAQVKTAVLLAALSADGVSTVTEPGPGRDHTERLLRYLGAPITVDGARATIDTRGWDGGLAGDEIIVPGDPSSSAFLIVAALLAGTMADGLTIRNVCVNPTRSGFLDVLVAMGATIERRAPRDAGGEPVADLHVPAGHAPLLRATDIGGDLTVRCLDEIPILAVACALADGVSTIRDGEELRVKESDRVATTCAMLRAFGVEVEERPDGMVIQGRGGQGPLTAARIHAAGDHRIAMAGAVAGLRADGPSRIDDADNVATSYPGFVAAMQALGAAVSVAEA